MTEPAPGCVHHWRIVDLTGKCLKCGAVKVFPDLSHQTPAQRRAMLAEAAEEARLCKKTPSVGEAVEGAETE
jgi:hypothetical protein